MSKIVKPSIYVVLGIIIFFTVSLIMAVTSFYTYQTTKNKIEDKMKADAILSGLSLEKNISDLMQAYAVNDYMRIVGNELEHHNSFGIIIEDLKMGEIVGEEVFVSGRIRDAQWKAIDYNANSNVQNQQLANSYYSYTHIIKSVDDETLGTIKIYMSDRDMRKELRGILLENFINTIAIALMLMASLFISIRLLLLRHLDDIIASIKHVDAAGIPFEHISEHGPREIALLSTTINVMIEAIKASRAKLQEREQNLAITLNSIGDAVIATDKKGNVTNMNPVAENLTGWSLQESQGLPLKTIFTIIDASTREPIENPVDKVISTGETIYLSNHTTLISKDGTEYQIADSAAAIKDNGDILGMVLVFNDVTEQYQLRDAASKNEKYMQSIMDNSPAVIYVKDIEGRFIFINKQFIELFHIKNEDIAGKTLYQVFPHDIAEIMESNDKNVLVSGKALESEEIAHSDDGDRTYNSIKFPLYDSDNNIYAICGISTDITDKKKKDEQLRRSQKMDALGKLTGGIAHDYNNMLGVILGYSELIEDMALDQPILTAYISKIKHAGERGVKLTKKLLTFSKQKSSENKIINLNALLESSQHMIEKTLTVRIKLLYELENKCWSINIDEGDLEDALLNMSINAMHAIEGNGTLTFETRNEIINEIDARDLEIPAGDYVLLSITDTGCGMDNKTKENIFDPFFSTKADFGTGLGLSQVYGFIQRSKGNIKVYSELGHGSRFTLYFPRYYKSELEEKQFKEEKTNLSGNQIILVVDDEPALAELTSHILTQQGYSVFIASSGKEALLILEKEKINVLVSDVIMSEMDGYELASIVQEKYPNIKIQLVSGFNDDRQSGHINTSLHENLLHKPYNSKKLLLRIQELVKSTGDG